jgi:hypothetical protein
VIKYTRAVKFYDRPLSSGENQTEDSALNGRNLRSTFDPMGSIRLILSTSFVVGCVRAQKEALIGQKHSPHRIIRVIAYGWKIGSFEF